MPKCEFSLRVVVNLMMSVNHVNFNNVHSENDNFSPDESEHSDSEVSNDATDAGSVNSDSECELDL